MISLLKTEALPYIPKISFMQTACLLAAFKDSPLEPDTWVQRINGRIVAVISRYGARLNITSIDADYDEIKEFIMVIGFNEIFCEKDTAIGLGFGRFDSFSVLRRNTVKTKDCLDIPPLNELYTALKQGEDGKIILPDFETFAADLSHRLRHGAAVALTDDFGGAIAFKCNFGGIINGIAVNKDNRARGIGSRLLNRTCDCLNGDVFVCTDTKTADFYVKNGFKVCDTAVIIRG